MQCPKCSRELFDVEQSLVTLDCCPGCHGLWFDRGELEKLTGIDDIVSEVRAGEPTELACPRCEQLLSVHKTSSVSVERCGHCGGVWLDRGELDAFRQRERRKPSPRRRTAKPEVLTLKEFLLKFIDSSIDKLQESP